MAFIGWAVGGRGTDFFFLVCDAFSIGSIEGKGILAQVEANVRSGQGSGGEPALVAVRPTKEMGECLGIFLWVSRRLGELVSHVGCGTHCY